MSCFGFESFDSLNLKHGDPLLMLKTRDRLQILTASRARLTLKKSCQVDGFGPRRIQVSYFQKE